MKDQLLHQHEQLYQAQAAAAAATSRGVARARETQGDGARRKVSDGSAANSAGSGKT